MEAVLDLLGGQDLGEGLAAREHLSAYLTDTWGE
jgi:hypothetical protein